MGVFLNILFWIFAVLFLILALVLLVKVTVVFNFKKQKGEDATVALQLRFFGGLFKKNIPLDQKKDKHKDSKKSKEDSDLKFFEKVKKYYSDFLTFKSVYNENSKRIRKSVYAKKINLDINFGLGDAARTGIATGYAWAGIYNVVAFVAKIIRIKEPKINITPCYNELKCDASCECIITARPVNLIITALGLYKSYKKIINKKI